MMRRRLLILIALIITGIYTAGYVYVRNEKLLIHRSGHAGGLTDNHRIERGDFIQWGGPDYPLASYWFFTPLRWAETCYWYLRHPVGQPWPYS